MNFWVPERMTTDGAIAYKSLEMGEFIRNWGVEHHQTAAYQPHSNLWAEGAVRSVQKFVEECVSRTDSVHEDAPGSSACGAQQTEIEARMSTHC